MARAQQPAMAVVGILSLGRKTQNSPELTGLRRGLAEHGFVEGRNISLEVRAANNNNNLLPALALDLVEHRSAVIVALGSPNAVTAAKAASATVPIAFVTAVDPVDNGFVASLNRPGGNATGLSVLSTELIGKRLGLLLELAPKVKTIGYLSGPSNSPVFEDWRARTIAAARHSGATSSFRPCGRTGISRRSLQCLSNARSA
jgi:putative ABC transport system substrate-binding protein